MTLTAPAVAVLLAIFGSTVWAFPSYDGCEDCHGDFSTGMYTSLQDGTNWGTNLMRGHEPFVGNTCNACHKSGGFGEVFLNFSEDATLSKGCVGCHGRDEDVTGNCTGLSGSQGGVEAECGSGAGLRQYHESQVGSGTCSSCHDGDANPVGEHIAPFNYGKSGVVMKDSCDDDGTESQFGATGVDNDGDGQRDGLDPDCQENGLPKFTINTAISDAWFFPPTGGQGFFIIVWEERKEIFLSWFTYDTVRPPEDVTAILGEPGHRWLTGQGSYEGDTALLDVFLTSGMIFDSDVPPAESVQLEGATIKIVWIGCNEGLVEYNIPSLGLSGDIPIERIVLDNVPACEAAQAQ